MMTRRITPSREAPMIDRRTFSMLAAAALASGAAARFAAAQAAGRPMAEGADEPPPIRPLKILVLGGTGFLGPALVTSAEQRGHELTLFLRGRTNPGLFPTIERIIGDRDPKVGEGVEGLKGDRRWDVVIDNSGYYPRHVGASASLLADRADRYLFVSTISVYAAHDTPGADEDAPLATMDDPSIESMGPRFEYYGPLKVLCEKAVESAFGDRACIIRPGYIVGRGDSTGRFTYWPLRVRLAHSDGGAVAAPGAPSDPVQQVDVRDLAHWMILCAERSTRGTFNATSAMDQFTFGSVLAACRKVTGSQAPVEWIDPDFLQAHAQRTGRGIGFPIWAPPSGPTAGLHQTSTARARKAGLRIRPLEETITDLLTWYDALEPDVRARQTAPGPPREVELALLDAWNKRDR